jgi:hypothetical protein
MAWVLNRKMVVGFVLAIAACGSSSQPTAQTGARFEMSVDIAPGGEAFKCLFVKLPAEAAFVSGGSHTYTAGSHHMLLFKTDLDEIPAGLAGVRDCYESASGIMSHIRGIVYGAQEPSGNVEFPPGVGLPVRPAEVLLLQAHYLNASPSPLQARVVVELKLAKAETIRERAGALFFYDPFIYVAPGAMGKASMRCRIRASIQLLGAASHYHRRGVSYGAYLDGADGSTVSSPFYTSSDWEHPQPMRSIMSVPAGARIRFECGYDNRTGTTAYYQGQSATESEMCMFTALYYPAMEATDEFCQREPDMFGVGSKSCLETSRCVQLCPPGSAPTGLGQGVAGAQVHECWQRCISDSCPNASGPLFAQFRCLRVQCGLECVTAGDECTRCMTSRCTNEVGACVAATCR